MKIKLLNLILVLSSFIILQPNLNYSSTYAIKISSNINFKQNSENFKLKSKMIKLEDFFKELESIKQNEAIKKQ